LWQFSSSFWLFKEVLKLTIKDNTFAKNIAVLCSSKHIKVRANDVSKTLKEN